VESQGVLTSFFQVGDNKIELLQAMSLESPISSFISQKGEGIHHIAYLVSDISREMNRLSKSGFSLIDEKPLKGADNMWVAFLHPKTTGGTLIELCQPIPLK
jgi:methylmalonyl-CoA/ethylmalonyl-CoA epimerase